MADIDEKRARFAQLHRSGIFLLANAWDAGSARILESLGVVAVATTSSGFAATLGRRDMQVTRDELVDHTARLAGSVDVPLSVDAERCFGDTPDEVAVTVGLLADAGASGCSIEDYDPATDGIDDITVSTERVAAAAAAADAAGMVLTARAENLIHGVLDLDDTIDRLHAYRRAGAHVSFAPGLETAADIGRVVSAMAELDAPVNVLKRPTAPPMSELAELGVRRVSVGGMFAFAAYGALVSAAREVLTDGTASFAERMITPSERAAAFGAG